MFLLNGGGLRLWCAFLHCFYVHLRNEWIAELVELPSCRSAWNLNDVNIPVYWNLVLASHPARRCWQEWIHCGSMLTPTLSSNLLAFDLFSKLTHLNVIPLLFNSFRSLIVTFLRERVFSHLPYHSASLSFRRT